MIKKEGGKVKGHYTPKTCILVAIKGFIVTTRMGHLIICIKFSKTITFGVNLRQTEFDGKVAKNADFSQKSAIFMFLYLFIIVTTSKMKSHLFFDDCKLPHLLKNVKMHRRAVLYFYNSLTFYSASWCFQEQIQKFHVKMWKKSWTV